MTLPIELVIFVFVFGAMLGSFTNAAIYRIPRKLDLIFDRSSCPNCKNLIRWYMNIPIFSWMFLRGKCSYCHNPISWRYPFVEAIAGIMAIIIFPDHLTLNALAIFFLKLNLFCSFLALFFIDIEFQLLPNKLNLYVLLILIPLAFLKNSILDSFLGGLIGFGLPYLVTYVYYLIRKKIGLGGGDIKLFGILGVYLGIQGIVQNIFLSCFLGSICGLIIIAIGRNKLDIRLAFGPYILIVASIQIFFPQIYQRILSYLLI